MSKSVQGRTEGLAFPKTNSKAALAEERRQRAKMHSEVRAKCLELDGYRCMNPECPSNRPYKDGSLPMIHPSQLDCAHVVGRGRGGDWSIGNVISLCKTFECHKQATEHHRKGQATPDQFMLKIVSFYEGKENDRWQESRACLALTVERKAAFK